MATIPILGSPDVGNREIANVLLQRLTGAPTGVEALHYYENGTDRVRVYTTTGWEDVAWQSDIAAAGVADNAITNTKLADMAQSTIKGRTAGAGTGDPVDLSVAQVKTILSLASGDISGLGALATLSAVGSAQITDGTVANGDLANMANATVKGRNTAGTGAPEDVTMSQLRTLLALTSSNISDFATAAVTAVNAGVIDADTLGGDTKAAIITAAVASIVDSAPSTLDTLNELAAALGDDANFATTITNALAAKAKLPTGHDLGDNSATDFAVTHNHNTRDLNISVVRKADWKGPVIVPYTITSVNVVTFNFDTAPTTAQYRATIAPAVA
jgi:hypothetical protein